MKVYNVAILGTGFGGLGMALRLKTEGETDFVILEKAASVGGTWRDNTYPGAACDVRSHLYWFSFAEPPTWSRTYCGQAEILDNIDTLVERSGLKEHIRFNTEVIDATWDDQALLWHIRTADNEVIAARWFVTAWGQLNRPSFAGIEGRANFKGELFHSSRWQHDVELEGKRVACIGNGPSAAQFIPELARQSGHLTVFQRSPNYVVPRLDRPYTEDEHRVFAALPPMRDASRNAIFLEHETWIGAMRQGTAKAAEFTFVARAQLESQVSDPVLREKLWPDYPVGCKRIVIADDYYPALVRPNVSLETTQIAGIESEGIRLADGRLIELDVIIFGTGFETQSLLGVADIKGRGGRSLRDAWTPAPEAYLGINVAGFPNLCMLYGPNTNLGHNSIVLMLECQIEYTLQAMRAAKAHDGQAVDVKAPVMAEYNRQLQQDLVGSSWAGSCSSWYKTADGRITNNWSGSVEDYRARCATFDLSEYELIRQPEPASV